LRHRIGRILAVAGLLVIAVITLVPLPRQIFASRLTPWYCLICGDHGGVDVINNALLFIPFGLGLRLSGIRARTALATGALLSLSIELLQWGVIPGRDASLSDVLTNSLGTALGVTLGAYHRRLLDPSPREALRLALAAGFLWLLTQLATAALLQPWVAPHELRGMWARSAYGRPPFDGQVVSATLSGSPLPGDSSLVPPEVARRLHEGRFELAVRLRSGYTSRWAPVVEVLGHRGAVLAIEADGDELAFQPPMRSASLRLGRPSLRLPGALPRGPSAEVQLRAEDRGAVLLAQWTEKGTQHTAVQPLSPSFGWSLLIPFRYGYGPGTPLLTMVWLAGWLLPTGYWIAAVRWGRPQRLLSLGLLLCCGLGLIPAIMGYRPVGWSEWLGACVGAAAGGAGYRFAAYLERRCDSPSIKESC
jgi:VanZ like family